MIPTIISYAGVRHIVTPDGTTTECGQPVNPKWTADRHVNRLCVKCENVVAPSRRLQIQRIKRRELK